MAENRTRINCLEGNYADHYTTIAYGCYACNNDLHFLIVKGRALQQITITNCYSTQVYQADRKLISNLEAIYARIFQERNNYFQNVKDKIIQPKILNDSCSITKFSVRK
jgi:hypothetical protein